MSPAAEEQELWIPAEASALGQAREVVDRAARAMGFDDDCRHRIRFAANEALTNAVQHGSPCEGRVLLRIVPETAALSVVVCDCGGSAPETPVPEDPPDELPERGRGLAVIRLLMDEVEVVPSPQRTVVRMVKRVDDEE